MFLPSSYMTGGIDEATPTPCRPFTLKSNVCLGDLVVIIACCIAGLGFLFWSVHAIRKMRTEFPFTFQPEKKRVEPGQGENVGPDPFPVPDGMDDSLGRRGIVQTPSLPQRVRTRMALTGSDEYFHYPYPGSSAPVSSDVYGAHSLVTIPRMPSRAGGQSHRTHHGSFSRGEFYGYQYEYEPYRSGHVNPSRVKGSPVHMPVPGGDYGSRQSMSRMNREGMTYEGL